MFKSVKTEINSRNFVKSLVAIKRIQLCVKTNKLKTVANCSRRKNHSRSEHFREFMKIDESFV